MINHLKYRFQMLSRMLYYAWHSRHVVEYDASSIDTLMYHHIKRVNKFMKSNKTHLEWNDNNKTSLMKKLSEFEELCKRKMDDEFDDHHYFSEVMDKLKEDSGVDANKLIFRVNRTDATDKLLKRALAKDREITKSLNDRYHYMYKHYLPMFWD